MIAALDCFRLTENISFEITAISRHNKQLEIAKKLGANKLINSLEVENNTLWNQFDIVYDTTGTPDGFQFALKISRNSFFFPLFLLLLSLSLFLLFTDENVF